MPRTLPAKTSCRLCKVMVTAPFAPLLPPVGRIISFQGTMWCHRTSWWACMQRMCSRAFEPSSWSSGLFAGIPSGSTPVVPRNYSLLCGLLLEVLRKSWGAGAQTWASCIQSLYSVCCTFFGLILELAWLKLWSLLKGKLNIKCQEESLVFFIWVNLVLIWVKRKMMSAFSIDWQPRVHMVALCVFPVPSGVCPSVEL